MLALHPGEIVDDLIDLVVDGERAVGRLPGEVRLLLSETFGTPQEFGSVTLTGTPISRVHILDAGQLLADDVEKRVVAEAGLVHLGGEKTRVFETPTGSPVCTGCDPSSVRPGVMVDSSVQL